MTHETRFNAAQAHPGKSVVGRLLPGGDLIHGLEEVCDEFELDYAAITFAYGSLSRASFQILQPTDIEDRPALAPFSMSRRVEFLGGQGLVCRDDSGNRATHLHGSVSDEQGVVRGGHFNPGENPIYNNLDFFLVELKGVTVTRVFDEETATIEMVVEQDDTTAGKGGS
jgi:hypothetical protein